MTRAITCRHLSPWWSPSARRTETAQRYDVNPRSGLRRSKVGRAESVAARAGGLLELGRMRRHLGARRRHHIGIGARRSRYCGSLGHVTGARKLHARCPRDATHAPDAPLPSQACPLVAGIGAQLRGTYPFLSGQEASKVLLCLATRYTVVSGLGADDSNLFVHGGADPGVLSATARECVMENSNYVFPPPSPPPPKSCGSCGADKDNNGGGLAAGTTVGIGVGIGVAAFVGLLAVGAYYFFRVHRHGGRRRRNSVTNRVAAKIAHVDNKCATTQMA